MIEGTAAPLPVEARDVTKAYGDLVAVDNVSFTVPAGRIVGLLGPNGAGKTTLLEILCGLRARDSGVVSVLGIDPGRHREQVLYRVGIMTQEFGLPPGVRTRQALKLFARLYPSPRDVDELLRELNLTEKARARFRQLSGGQRRRLALAKALVGDPELLVLDEPTAGLDPQGRDFLRERIRALRDEGRSIVLATHDIGDAELVCDDIVIIDQGGVIAQGSPEELIAEHTASHVVRLRECTTETVPVALVETTSASDRVLFVDDPSLTVELLGDRSSKHLVEVRRTTLEDVFLLLTGRELRT